MKNSGRHRSDGFRPDVEGLRAVAVLAVVVCHAGVGAFAGGYVGVDVFFVISGFLITGLLVREVERSGSVSFTRFYARRAKRLLPLAALVLAFVSVVSALLFTPVRRDLVSGDVIAAALSIVNWRFAHQAIDYFAAGQEASPVRHFWSLAVEEQFYLVWPALLLATTWWWRRRGRSARPAIWAVLALVAIASFAFGLRETVREPDAAYFSTLTRAWELALGGLLALGGASLARRLSRGAALAVGWAGLAGIAVACLAFSETTAMPGAAALLPTLATGALIVAGAAAPLPVLTLAPVRYVGRISYAWYLWHWPLYVFATAEWGPLTARQGLAVMAASLVPTIVSHHLVEARFHHAPKLSARPRLALRLGGVCIGVAVLAGVLVSATAPSVRTAAASEVEGAAAVTRASYELQRSADALRPNPRNADGDQPRMYHDGCWQGRSGTRSPACRYGNRGGKRKLLLFGDSHAAMWGPALEAVARRRGWQFVFLAKQGCSPAMTAIWNNPLGRHYHECDTWREETLRRIERSERADVIVVDGANFYSAADGERKLAFGASTAPMIAGTERTLRRLRATGARVVMMANSPFAPDDVPSCVSDHLDELDACAFARAEGYRRPPINREAAAAVRGVELIDSQPVVCPGARCPAVIGDVLVYRDDNHLTATYSRTLAPWLSHQLQLGRD